MSWKSRTTTPGRRARGEAVRPPLKILAVEDSASARKVFQTVLMRLGVSINDLRLAADAEEALRVFRQWQPDVVFLDVDLRRPPGSPPAPKTAGAPDGGVAPMDGDGLAQRLLEHEPHPHLVVVTAYDRDHPRVRTLVQRGVSDVIVKPVVAARVQSILQRLAGDGARVRED